MDLATGCEAEVPRRERLKQAGDDALLATGTAPSLWRFPLVSLGSHPPPPPQQKKCKDPFFSCFFFFFLSR